MTSLRLELGDLLQADAEALIVPIDGTMQPRPGKFDRILGNIGRQFERRFPDAELLEELESQLEFPLALGRAAPIEVSGTPFRHLVVVSTLHHADVLETSAKQALIRDGVRASLDVAATIGVRVLASGVLQGGWRLAPEEAFSSMLSALDHRPPNPELVVRCLEPELHSRIRNIAQSYGF